MFYELYVEGLTCAADGEPLLDGTHPVPDSYFTATSKAGRSWAARNVRMSAPNAWAPDLCTRDSPSCFVQVSYDFHF